MPPQSPPMLGVRPVRISPGLLSQGASPTLTVILSDADSLYYVMELFACKLPVPVAVSPQEAEHFLLAPCASVPLVGRAELSWPCPCGWGIESGAEGW